MYVTPLQIKFIDRKEASSFRCLSHPVCGTLDTISSPFLPYHPDHPKHPGTMNIRNSMAHLA